MAASSAEPPARRMSSPARAASGLAAAVLLGGLALSVPYQESRQGEVKFSSNHGMMVGDRKSVV
jgi:hypothetical protein